MIRLALLDIDGTILDRNGIVDNLVWQKIESAKRQGIQFAVDTGRSRHGLAISIAERLSPELPHIFQGGALVAYPRGHIVCADCLRKNIVLHAVSLAAKKGFALELHGGDEMYVAKDESLTRTHGEYNGIVPVVADPEKIANERDIYRALFIVEESKAATIRGEFPVTAELGVVRSVALPGYVFVSLAPRGVNKGSAARWLAGYLGIPLCDTMAVGDEEADEPMLEIVGKPFVMGTAGERLMKRFPSTGTVADNGVIRAIDLVLNENRMESSRLSSGL